MFGGGNMRILYVVFLLGSMIPFISYAQYSADEYIGEVDIVEDVDHIDLSELLKLQETIPVAEKNCLRIKKNVRECRCDNGYLYNEYDGIFNRMFDRNPNWDRKVLKYDFYLDGVTYKGETDKETLKNYTRSYKVLGCDIDNNNKIEKN